MPIQRLRRFALILSLFSAFACAALEGPTPNRQVQLSDADASLYWREVQRRVPTWFETGGVEAPALPSSQSVYSRVRFVEIPHEFLETCTFNSKTLEIQIGDDKWNSGCVPHELGHAVLWLLRHPCWGDFEHPNEDPRRC